jgi:DNA polymerase-1
MGIYMIAKTSTLIVDGYGFAFRAFHTQPSLTYKGTPVGCIYGFTAMLIKLINDFKPLRAVVVFDHGGKNFRHDIYPEYKQHRPPVPEDLKIQLPLLREAAKALNFKTIEEEGLEADDIIASLATHANFNGDRAIIVSSDKDLMQLVNEKIWMFDPVKQEYIKKEEVIKKFGIPPSQITEFLAIVGDTADNVPGIKGLGPKTAAELLTLYGSLQGIYDNIDLISQKKRKELLENGRENAFLSLELVKLKSDLEISWDNLSWTNPAGEQIFNFLQKYGFKSLIERAEKSFNLQQISQYTKNTEAENFDIKLKELDSAEDLEKVTKAILRHGIVGILLHNNSVLLSYEKEEIWEMSNKTINTEFLIKIIEDHSIIKITYDLKNLMHILKLQNFSSCQDVMLMYYAISAGNKQLSLPDIISSYFDINQSGYAINGNSCAFLCMLYPKLQSKLLEHKALSLYHDIDLPLCHILFDMENEGISLDQEKMKQLSNEFNIQTHKLEEQIIRMSGKNFNLASAKQLGEILFDHLKLPGGKKSSKSQHYTTSNEVLESLKHKGFEIADLIINWRHLTKLKNTYTDALPIQLNANSNKLHTNFSQVSTTTSRLSSIEPNLQNIPIRTKEGLMIRSAIIAPPKFTMISTDYSQIELRILAEVANISSMQQAFKDNQDIHASTASEMFEVPIAEVTPELRRKAKAINFGIIYGISAYGLAENLGISNKQADEYIKNYFLKYPEIEGYFKSTKEFAYKHGFVKNLFGRKCFIPGINDKNFYIRNFAERAAINAPIQGSAADITKIAMIKLFNELRKNNYKTKIVLQIHDEILLISPDEEVAAVRPIISSCMQNAADLKIPLVANIKTGHNWAELI